MVVGRARSPGLRGTERGAGERGQLADDGEAERVGEGGGPVRGHGLAGHRVVPFKLVATAGTLPLSERSIQAAGWRLEVRPTRAGRRAPVPSPPAVDKRAAATSSPPSADARTTEQTASLTPDYCPISGVGSVLPGAPSEGAMTTTDATA